MSGDIDKNKEQDVDELESDADDNEALDEDIVEGAHEQTVVDADVEKLVERMDETDAEEAARKAEVRRKLEEAKEQRDDDLDSTYNFNLDDDL